MHIFSLSNWLKAFKNHLVRAPTPHPGLQELDQMPVQSLPRYVQDCPVAMKYLSLLGQLDWNHFPERPDQRSAPDVPPLPYACLAAAHLVKIEQHLTYVADLRV